MYIQSGLCTIEIMSTTSMPVFFNKVACVYLQTHLCRDYQNHPHLLDHQNPLEKISKIKKIFVKGKLFLILDKFKKENFEKFSQKKYFKNIKQKKIIFKNQKKNHLHLHGHQSRHPHVGVHHRTLLGDLYLVDLHKKHRYIVNNFSMKL